MVWQGTLVLAEKLTPAFPILTSTICLTGILAGFLAIISLFATVQEVRKQTSLLTEEAARVAGGEADYDLAETSVKWLGYRFMHDQASKTGPSAFPWFRIEAASSNGCGLSLGILSQDERGRWLLLKELPLPPELLHKNRNFHYLVQADYVAKSEALFGKLPTVRINCRAKAPVTHPSGLIGAGPPVSLVQAAARTSLYQAGDSD